MSPLDALNILKAIDALMTLAIRSGLSMEEYRNLKAESGGGPLTEEQLQQLSSRLRDSLERM
jgi:hypothetical protein